MTGTGDGRVIGLLAAGCGGLESRWRTEIVRPLCERGWRPAITLTPVAASWLADAGELDELARLSEFPVRSTSRLPGRPRPHPDPDVFLFAPASANTVAKLALGLADNQALTVVGDVIGNPAVHVAVGYSVYDVRSAHPAWPGHLAALAGAGVALARLDPSRPWTEVLDLLPDADPGPS